MSGQVPRGAAPGLGATRTGATKCCSKGSYLAGERRGPVGRASAWDISVATWPGGVAARRRAGSRPHAATPSTGERGWVGAKHALRQAGPERKGSGLKTQKKSVPFMDGAGLLVVLLSLPATLAHGRAFPSRSRLVRLAATAPTPQHSERAAEWTSLEGCWLLRPQGTPKGVIHFFGGVVAAAAPQLTYGYMLSQLTTRGYAVVAIPFNVTFNHTETAMHLGARFAAVKRALATDAAGLGGLPSFGLGHSLGAVLLLLLACTDGGVASSIAGMGALAYNHRPLRETVPGYRPLVVPLVGALGRTLSTVWPLRAMLHAAPSWRARIFQAARRVAASTTWVSPRASAWLDRVSEAAKMPDQVTKLVLAVRDGTSEFIPLAEELCALYSASAERLPRHALLVSFTSAWVGRDPLDDSEQVAEALACSSVRVERVTLPGTHTTPLDVGANTGSRTDSPRAPGPSQQAAQAPVDMLVDAIDRWAMAIGGGQEAGTGAVPLHTSQSGPSPRDNRPPVADSSATGLPRGSSPSTCREETMPRAFWQGHPRPPVPRTWD